MRIRISFDKRRCTGAFICTNEDPDHFEIGNGKARLIGGESSPTGVYSLEDDVERGGVERAVAAAEGCPAGAIEVEELDTAERLNEGS